MPLADGEFNEPMSWRLLCFSILNLVFLCMSILSLAGSSLLWNLNLSCPCSVDSTHLEVSVFSAFLQGLSGLSQWIQLNNNLLQSRRCCFPISYNLLSLVCLTAIPYPSRRFRYYVTICITVWFKMNFWVMPSLK